MENCYWDRSREIKMFKNKNIAIIGGGIIGLAVAYKLSAKDALVHVFEKESSVGLHQSGRNSGVLHCGYITSQDP